MLSLADLRPGELGKIAGFATGNGIVQRLQEMGLTIGEPFAVLALAPLGDPIEIRIRGYQLSLRKREAKLISVDRTSA